ncbi:DUF4357 domain-containing protein [Phragmitibacter flavus]|uniref:DUF4357 domain-containing protein n=1 Tax=Phragmitibacter flavus TaxID=2576071 RepID=A0A5R8KGA1_9BACT|nr:DUF4357 domain-containing protein [Phragmitibacter flavus]TLD70975.1 DUF4357 domain-containing protein [Phragmitibacter flavus]
MSTSLESIQEHLEGIRHWLDQVDAIAMPEQHPSGLSSQEKQELRRVDALIEQLKAMGVGSIPAELVDKKCELTARDASFAEMSEATLLLPAVEELCRYLAELSKRSRITRNKIRTHTAKQVPRAYHDVEPLDLLNAGYLSTDDRLELQWSKQHDVYEGKLEGDGRIRANTQDGWMAFSSLSSAAQYISGRPQNGWEHWRRINDDGSRTPLKKIREQYQEENEDV